MACSRPSLCKFVVFVVFINILFITYLLNVLNGDDSIDISVDNEPQIKPHHLCIIVPYRDRMEELSEFAPYLNTFLNRQDVMHTFLVMNQTDKYRFNRASLINVGWMEGDRIDCDYMVMHDVDLLPQNPEIDYRFPGEGTVRHISSPQYHPKYNYSNFIGGILMLTMRDYKALNGMSNKYWGWGLEDDEFWLRIKENSRMRLTRVEDLKTDRRTSFRHIHGPERKRDYAVVTKEQTAFKRKRDRISGLSNVNYKITSRRILTFNSAVVRVVDVDLECDLKWTNYCLPKL